MDTSTQLKLLIVIGEIAFALWDEVSDIIYISTQETFNPLMKYFLLFFIIASPVVQTIAYMMILGITQLKNTGYVDPEANDRLKTATNIFEEIWIIIKVYVVYYCRAAKEAVKQTCLAFLIMILQELKIFGPILFYYIKKKYNLIFTKNLMGGMEQIVEQKRKVQVIKRQEKKIKKREEKKKLRKLSKLQLQSLEIKKYKSKNDNTENNNNNQTGSPDDDSSPNKNSNPNNFDDNNMLDYEKQPRKQKQKNKIKFVKGEEEYQPGNDDDEEITKARVPRLQTAQSKGQLDYLTDFNNNWEKHNKQQQQQFFQQQKNNSGITTQSFQSHDNIINNSNFGSGVNIKGHHRKQDSSSYLQPTQQQQQQQQQLQLLQQRQSKQYEEFIRKNPKKNTTILISNFEELNSNNNNNNLQLQNHNFQNYFSGSPQPSPSSKKTQNIIQDNAFKKALHLYLDAKLEPDLSIIIDDYNFKHLMLVGNLFEAFFECLPQAILQFINNEMLKDKKAEGEQSWSLFQIITFTTSCIALLMYCIRLIHLLLGDKLDIFLGTLEYLKSDKEFISDVIQTPKRIEVKNDLNLLQKLSLIREDLEGEQLQEIYIDMVGYKADRALVISYIQKIILKKYPSCFKSFTLRLKETTIDSTYSKTFEREFRETQQNNQKNPNSDNILVDIFIQDYNFQDQLENKKNTYLHIAQIKDFLSLCEYKNKAFFQRIKEIKIESKLNLETDDEKIKKTIKKISNIQKLHFENLEYLDVNFTEYKSFPKLSENTYISNYFVEVFKQFTLRHSKIDPEKSFFMKLFGFDILQAEKTGSVKIDNPQIFQYFCMDPCGFIQKVNINLEKPLSTEYQQITQNLLIKFSRKNFSDLQEINFQLIGFQRKLDLVLYNNLKMNEKNNKITYLGDNPTYKFNIGESEETYIKNRIDLATEKIRLCNMLDFDFILNPLALNLPIKELYIQMTLGDQSLIQHVQRFFDLKFQLYYGRQKHLNKLDIHINHYNQVMQKDLNNSFDVSKISQQFNVVNNGLKDKNKTEDISNNHILEEAKESKTSQHEIGTDIALNFKHSVSESPVKSSINSKQKLSKYLQNDNHNNDLKASTQNIVGTQNYFNSNSQNDYEYNSQLNQYEINKQTKNIINNNVNAGICIIKQLKEAKMQEQNFGKKLSQCLQFDLEKQNSIYILVQESRITVDQIEGRLKMQPSFVTKLDLDIPDNQLNNLGFFHYVSQFKILKELKIDFSNNYRGNSISELQAKQISKMLYEIPQITSLHLNLQGNEQISGSGDFELQLAKTLKRLNQLKTIYLNLKQTYIKDTGKNAIIQVLKACPTLQNKTILFDD